VDQHVDAYSLATGFKEFVQREWSNPLMEERAGPIGKGHLWGFFQDWADEIDLLGKVAGNQVMALQTWIIVSAWFAQKPEDFSAIRDYVTVPLDLARYSELRWLPDLLDQAEWNSRVFNRKYGQQ
jgi:hypothetical protein